MNIHEILVIVMVAVIVFKPEHLPEVAKFLGKTVRQAKKIFSDLQSSHDSSLLTFLNPKDAEERKY